jgi:DNA-binding NarL/FixJ family response regulator
LPHELARLSPQEEQILGAGGQGLRSKEIADALSLSPQAVQTHVWNICEKLLVRSRVEAVAHYLRK